MTVDGMAGKAALELRHCGPQVHLHMLQGSVLRWFPMRLFRVRRSRPRAFSDTTLTVTTDGHTLQLTSDKRLLGKKPESAFVLVDRDFRLPSTFPVMGYGAIRKPPYAWPGAKREWEGCRAGGTTATSSGAWSRCSWRSRVLRARCVLATKPALPGETVAVQPCVPIAKATLVVAAPVKLPPDTAKN